MSDLLEKITVIHQSRVINKTDTGRSYRISYAGSETDIDNYIKTLKIGTYYSEFQGYLSNIQKSQLAANQWKLDLEYRVDYPSGSKPEEEPEQEQEEPVWNQKKTATLSVRNLQLPLERLDNYLTCWNHYLIGRNNSPLPSWAETTNQILISANDSKNYKWVKSISEIPDPTETESWKVILKPKKGGVQYYDFAVFVVTQSARFKNADDAGRAVKRSINTITSPENDFGLTGGNWKHDESSISWDGEYWLATNVYTLSGDIKGWDRDIYGG